MSYECAFGDGTAGHPVNWLITRLQPAATISLCGDDFPVGIIPVLASELGVDQARLYDTIKRFVDREQAREAKQAGKAAAAAVDGAPAGPNDSDLPDAGDGEGVDAEDAVWGEPAADMLKAEQ